MSITNPDMVVLTMKESIDTERLRTVKRPTHSVRHLQRRVRPVIPVTSPLPTYQCVPAVLPGLWND